MSGWLTKVTSVLLALFFPWVSAASGGMVLCFGPDGRVGYGPGGELACTGVESLVEAEHPAATPCTECLDAEGCAHVPGKSLLHRPPPGAAQRRGLSGQTAPFALTMIRADSGAPEAPVSPPPHVLDGQHGMRLRLVALRTVVLRL